MTRSSQNWIHKPGGWDALNTQRVLFDSLNSYGFPDLDPFTSEITKSRKLFSYSHRDHNGRQHSAGICHFFIDDYRFESVWNRPTAVLLKMQQFWATTTPDFSIYTDWPVIIQQWNIYRSRWIGRFWQAHGIPVIPTVNWSDEASWEWCFGGIPKASVLAISVPDIRRPEVSHNFRHGFFEMIRRTHPRQIIVYGTLPFTSRICLEYTPSWIHMRTAINTTQLKATG